MFRLILAAALVAASHAPAAWGSGACFAPASRSGGFAAPQFQPQFQPPAHLPVVSYPAAPALPPAVVAAPVLDDAAVEAAVKRHLGAAVVTAVERRFAIEAEKARLAAKGGCCVGSCRCDRCPDAGGCPCRDGAGRCGDGCSCVVAPKGELPPLFGLDRQRIAEPQTPEILHVGKDGVRRISKPESFRLLEQGLPDDAGKRRLTLIGSEADCKRVADDLAGHPALARYRNDFTVQSYRPDHWDVKDKGFKVGGTPTVYVQAPDGLVLHRQDSYAGGPEALAKALMRTAPDYDPAKDPDLTKPPVKPDDKKPAPDDKKPSNPDGKPKTPQALYWVLGALLAALVLTRKAN